MFRMYIAFSKKLLANSLSVIRLDQLLKSISSGR